LPYLIITQFKDGISFETLMGKEMFPEFSSSYNEKKAFRINKYRWKEDIKTKVRKYGIKLGTNLSCTG
jgi:hypothetical protein